MRSLAGVNCLPMTPFTLDGEVDENSLRRLVEHDAEGGFTSLIAMGRAGESMYLSMAERRRVMKVVVDQVGGRVPVGFGIIDASYEEGLEVGRYAREYGADFVMSRPPVDGDISDYYRRLTENVPVIVYDIGVQRVLSIESDILPLVEDTGNVVGVKISSEPEKTREAKRLLPVPVLCGWEIMSLLAYRMGADGVTSACAQLLPRETLNLHRYAVEERWDEARDVFYGSLLPVMNYLPGGPNMTGWSVCKHILYWRGVISTPLVRPPSLPAEEERLEEVRRLLQRDSGER